VVEADLETEVLAITPPGLADPEEVAEVRALAC